MIRRKKKPAKSKYSDESFIGLEPDWKDADKWSGEKYYRERSRIAYYYSYYFKTKDFIFLGSSSNGNTCWEKS